MEPCTLLQLQLGELQEPSHIFPVQWCCLRWDEIIIGFSMANNFHPHLQPPNRRMDVSTIESFQLPFCWWREKAQGNWNLMKLLKLREKVENNVLFGCGFNLLKNVPGSMVPAICETPKELPQLSSGLTKLAFFAMHGLVVMSPRQGKSLDSNWFGCSARHAHSPTCAPMEGLPPGTQLQLRQKPPAATISWNWPCTSRHFVRSPAHLARNDLNRRKTATVETKSHSKLKHDNSFAKSPCVSLQLEWNKCKNWSTGQTSQALCSWQAPWIAIANASRLPARL